MMRLVQTGEHVPSDYRETGNQERCVAGMSVVLRLGSELARGRSFRNGTITGSFTLPSFLPSFLGTAQLDTSKS